MATTQNRTFFGGSTTSGSGVYPEDIKILKVFKNYAETDYNPLASSDTSVYIPTIEKVDSSGTNIQVTIQKILVSGGYPVLVHNGSEYGYIRTANGRYVFTCIDSITVAKQAEVNIQDGTITTDSSSIGGVSILARNESDLFLKITTVLTLGKVPIILDNGAYYHLVAKTGTLAKFARNTSSGTLQVLSVNNNNQTTLSTFTFLESTGDASNTTSTFTKASGDTSAMASGTKLSVIFSAISNFFASVLSALNNVKTKQTAVTDPTADGTGLSFIDSVTQNTNGEITPHKKFVQDGTTAQKGVVQLQDSIGTTESATDKAVTPHAVREAIDTVVSSAYHAAGTKTVAQLTGSLLVAGNNGSVYNITDSGTTTSDFVDGAGHPINAGDNVGVCDIGGGVYKFDLLSGFVDLSNYLAKTGNASNTTSTLTKNASDTSSMTSGNKLSVLFTAISNFFASLKALAFKDTVGTSDIADDAITAAKVKDNETLPVGVSGHSNISYTQDSFRINKDDNTNKVWAKVAVSSDPIHTWYGYGITLVCAFDGYGNKGLAAVLSCVYTVYGNYPYGDHTFTAYTYAGLPFDAKLVVNDGILEIWMKAPDTGGGLFVTQIGKARRFSLNYSWSDDRSYQKTEAEFSAYISDKTSYALTKSYLAQSGGTSGQYLKSNGANNAPSWDDPSNLSVGNATYATKIGSNSSHSQIGSQSIPVYVDSNGQVQPCTPSSMSVGSATNVDLSKTVDAVNGDSIQAGTGASVKIGNAGNAKKWDGYAISVGTVVSSAGTISIA